MNLKVRGGKRPTPSAGKKCSSCPTTVLAYMYIQVMLMSAFVMVCTVRSVSCLLFSTHGDPVPSRL